MWNDRIQMRTPRQTGLLVAWLCAVVFMLIGPAAAERQPNHGGQDIGATTQNYLRTFYPIWFTHSQFKIAPKNELFGPEKITPVYQSVVAINDDTLYASAPIDLPVAPGEKVEIFVPQTSAGYSVLLLDPYGNVYPSPVPSKPAGVVWPQATYTLVRPSFQGSLGPNTARLPLDFMVMIFRVDRFGNGVDQTAEATAFRMALAIDGAATKVKPVEEFSIPFKTIADTLIRTDPIEFLRQIQVAVGDKSSTPPLSPQQHRLSEDFNALFGDGSSLGPNERAQFAAGARAAHDAIIANYLNKTDANHWVHFTNIGEWKSAVLDRASITQFCQYCNTIATAAYYHAFADGTGAPLEGSAPQGYVLTFPPGGTPAATRFWSLTAYTPEAIQPIPNAIDKYLVASYTPGLVTNQDGSISIYISQTQPAGVAQANWLPVSDRAFNVMLRVYGVVAKSDVARNKYLPPPVVRR